MNRHDDVSESNWLEGLIDERAEVRRRLRELELVKNGKPAMEKAQLAACRHVIDLLTRQIDEQKAMMECRLRMVSSIDDVCDGMRELATDECGRLVDHDSPHPLRAPLMTMLLNAQHAGVLSSSNNDWFKEQVGAL